MAVKMRPTDSWTKRPRAALLQLGTGFLVEIVENRRERADFVRSRKVEYRSFQLENLTYEIFKRFQGHCLVGSLTGEVAC
jgi:hypothetical protein